VYAGHFAIAIAMKARKPDIPVLPIFVGVGLLDVLNGLFVVAGWDRVTANLSSGPYLFFDLTFIDWDHSLVAAIVWSVLWGFAFSKRRPVALAAALAAFSHFLADWPLHNGDLALYPHSVDHLGLGLWSSLGVGAWALEGVFTLVLCGYAWAMQARRGVSMLWPSVVVAALFANLSPWTSPMKWVAMLTEPAAHLAQGVLVATGFAVPGALLIWLVERAERLRVDVAPTAAASS
jgi:hypothetical protein